MCWHVFIHILGCLIVKESMGYNIPVPFVVSGIGLVPPVSKPTEPCAPALLTPVEGTGLSDRLRVSVPCRKWGEYFRSCVFEGCPIFLRWVSRVQVSSISMLHPTGHLSRLVHPGLSLAAKTWVLHVQGPSATLICYSLLLLSFSADFIEHLASHLLPVPS